MAEQVVVVSGWKDIAKYIGKGVRTAQRYEREVALPVRRPGGKSTGSVIAMKTELDEWMAAESVRKAARLAQSNLPSLEIVKDFQHSVAEMRRLQEEALRLGKAIRESLQGFVAIRSVRPAGELHAAELEMQACVSTLPDALSLTATAQPRPEVVEQRPPLSPRQPHSEFDGEW